MRNKFLLLAAAAALVACGHRDESPTGPTRDVPRSVSLRPAAPAPAGPAEVAAQAVSPSLGTAASYAALGGSTVTNTGPTTLKGDLGVFAGTAIVGFPPGTVTGVTHAGDPAAGTAQGDSTTAYGALAAQPCTATLTGQDLGGKSLPTGVYCFSSSAQLTGTLTLTGSGPWVFQIGSTLTTASNSAVVFAGGRACRAWWQVGSSATLGTGTDFGGNILALASITLNTGARNDGGLLAQTGAVTLASNSVKAVGSCAAPPPPPPPPTPKPPKPTPGPGNPGPNPKPPHHVPALPAPGFAMLVALLVLVSLWKRGQ